MEAVLLREAGDPMVLVRIGRAPGPRAYVQPMSRIDGAGCLITLWNRRRDPIDDYAGRVILDRSGAAIERAIYEDADPYWKDMPWFGWLLDMAVDAGLEFDPA
jgi:hypothetical protein